MTLSRSSASACRRSSVMNASSACIEVNRRSWISSGCPPVPLPPSPLEHPATVPSSDAQDLVLVGDQVILGPWPRPQQDAQSQTHSADLRDSDFCIPAECLTGNEPAAMRGATEPSRRTYRPKLCC